MTNGSALSYTPDVVGIIVPREVFFLKYYQWGTVLCDNEMYGTK